MTKNISIVFLTILMLLCSCSTTKEAYLTKKPNKEIQTDSLAYPPHYSLPAKLETTSEDFN